MVNLSSVSFMLAKETASGALGTMLTGMLFKVAAQLVLSTMTPEGSVLWTGTLFTAEILA